MKKAVKIAKWTLISVLGLILIPILIQMILNNAYIGRADKDYIDYLNNNKTSSPTGNFSDDDLRNIFSDEVYSNQIVLLGEMHGYAEVQNIDKTLFMHFNRTKGTRYYVAEIDSACASQLNIFLNKEKKDLAILEDVVLKVKSRIPQQATVELVQKWSDIYDYNKTLSDSSKIVVLGIDIKFGDKMRANRDSLMMENFADIVRLKGLDNETFYGYFGLFHVLQDGIGPRNNQSFASLLKSNNFDVTSICSVNVEGEMYIPFDALYIKNKKSTYLEVDGPLMLTKGIRDLKKASLENSITLFKLNKEDSPYNKGQKLLLSIPSFYLITRNQRLAPYDENASTLDFVQYAILLRGATPITPME